MKTEFREMTVFEYVVRWAAEVVRLPERADAAIGNLQELAMNFDLTEGEMNLVLDTIDAIRESTHEARSRES